MFPLPWNFPFRKKDGTVVNVEDAISGGGGSDLPDYDSSDAGKVLGVDENGDLEWSDEVNSEIQTLTNNVDLLIENGAINNLPSEAVNATVTTDGANLTFTVNDDKSVIVNGTNGNSTVRYPIFASAETPQIYKPIGGKGPYKISGVKNGSADTYGLVFQASNTTSGEHAEAHDLYDGEAEIGNYSYYRCYIIIKAGVTLNNVKFEPMMTSPSYFGGYVPYAMTNRELTEVIDSYSTTSSKNVSVDGVGLLFSKVGNMVTLTFSGTSTENITENIDFYELTGALKNAIHLDTLLIGGQRMQLDLLHHSIRFSVAIPSGASLRGTILYVADNFDVIT